MAASINKVILIGTAGKDPEVKTFQNGNKVVTLSIATSDTWKDKASGERKEKTVWHRVVIFDTRLADVAEKYVRKGSRVYIEGAIDHRKYTPRDGGEERQITEIILQSFRGALTLLSAQPSDRSEDDYPPQRQATRTDPRGNPQYSGGDLDEEIPV